MQKHKIITTAFAALFIGVSAVNALTPVRAFSESENRFLAKFPAFSWEKLVSGEFIGGFETYTNDQFLLRDQLIGVNVLAQLGLGRQDINGVFLGKDSYLIEKHDAVDEAVQQRNLKALFAFFDSLSEKELQSFTAMLVPTASAILTEKLPEHAVQYDQDLLLDAVQAQLGNHFVDVRDALSAHKEEGIYYRTDHHWTTLGAYYAYEEWCEATGRPVPSLADYEQTLVADDFLGTIYSKVQLPFVKEDVIYTFVDGDYPVTYNYQDKEERIYADSFLEGRDKYAYFLNSNNAVAEIEGRGEGHMLVVKDSYANCFIPFLCDEFAKITVIDFRYYSGSVSQLMEEEGVTDVLVLYNVMGFSGESSVYKLNK